jgi:1,4-alpha-glucan branching enzyme
MTAQELESILNGTHGDPFSILGPHQTGDGEWEVRAYLPQAMDAAIRTAGATYPMRKTRTEGFFVATPARDPGRYQLQLTLWNGGQAEIDDPYRFPRLISDFDLHIHGEGTQYESYRTMGAHLVECDGVAGVRFAVWAPNAEVVTVVGDFNDWDERRHPMRLRSGGVWEIFLPGVGAGINYKYSVRAHSHGFRQQKADPYGFATEVPPKSATVVCDLASYQWGDQQWMESRAHRDHLKDPRCTS